MKELLWTFEDVVRFVDHPDRPLRHWALERLTKRFPHRAGDALLAMVDDPDGYISLMAAEFLAETGDREKYGPRLLERLAEAEGVRFGYLAQALARLDHREALPLILDRVGSAAQATESLDANAFLYLVGALGTFAGEPVRQRLWQILDSFPGDGLFVDVVMKAVLDAAQPEDIPRLVQFYRSRPSGPYSSRELAVFASALGAERLAQEMGYAVGEGLAKTLERAEGWLDLQPELSEPCRRDLRAAFGHEHQGVFDVLLREARRMIEQRGDDLAAWRTAWRAGERPLGYRREALFVPLILEAFAARPAPHREQRTDESALGLALLCQFSVSRDDQARLEGAGDRTEMLLAILSEDRQNVLPGIVDQAAALGPGIVSWLVDRIEPDGSRWGMIRVIETIERLARRHPGSCDVAIPLLIETINDRQGDYVLEACSRALEAIGPAAVEPIVQHLRDPDMARQIYLTGVLEQMPTEGAAQAILAWLEEGEPLDEAHVVALAGIGSPSAIEPLYRYWKSERGQERLLAEYLLVLCELNGVEKPELSEWRRIVEAEDARLAQVLRGMEFSVGGEASAGGESLPVQGDRHPDRGPGPRPPRKSQGVSKRERKRRSAQKKSQRRGKKKRRR
jgi:HEAT repeat protein